MNPRYPTNKRYRRRNNRSPVAVILLGLVAGGGGYLLFGGKSPQNSVVTPDPVTTRPTELAEQKENTVRQPEKKSSNKGQIAAAKQDKKGSDESRAVIEPEEKNRHLALKVSDVIVLPTRAISVSRDHVATEKTKDHSQKVKDQPSGTPASPSEVKENPGSNAPAAAAGSEEEAPKTADSPSPPQDLTPKQKPPDVELTFYDALASRKVVLPQEVHEQAATTAVRSGTPVKPQLPGAQTRIIAAASPTTVALPTVGKNFQDLSRLINESVQKKGTTAQPTNQPATQSSEDSGAYMVQLAVFSNAERANQMVTQLQRKGRTVHMVQSEGSAGPVYRVRSGPYPTLADAKVAMDALPTDGQAPVIIKPTGR
ncbi:MAG: SPOR domain-containing protein [Magnetococcales bacterium]|nr:SPOR domain-containing protein [Magnetococcales bacterium]MBF0149658.1 SPOR domain-containing protein [Magnetococcales bacterium]